MKESAYEGMG